MCKEKDDLGWRRQNLQAGGMDGRSEPRGAQSPEEHTASSEVARASPLLTLPLGDFSSRSCQVSLSVGPSTQRSPLRTLLPTAAAAA